jgi:predicted DNA-binding transcriptional regulator AlpA
MATMDNALLSVTAAAKLVGKHPPQLYKYIQEEGMPSHKDSEGKTRVVLSEVKAFLDERASSPKARGGGANTESALSKAAVAQYITPFVTKPVLSLWDRGSDKGWAVAAITDAPDIEYDTEEEGHISQKLVRFAVDYRKEDVAWSDDRIIQEVVDGKIVIAEPQGVLRLIAAQLKLFDPEVRPTEIISQLQEVAKALDALKLAALSNAKV